MTQPFEAHGVAPERDGDGGTRPVVHMWRSALRWLIVGAFLLRAGLGVLDVQSVTSDSVRTVPLLSSVTFASSSAAWPLVWGTLALVSALTLAVRMRLGWLLALAVAFAYFVAGIADVTAQVDAEGSVWSAGGTILVSLVVPIVILSGLLAIRDWYLPTARRIRLGHQPGAGHA